MPQQQQQPIQGDGWSQPVRPGVEPRSSEQVSEGLTEEVKKAKIDAPKGTKFAMYKDDNVVMLQRAEDGSYYVDDQGAPKATFVRKTSKDIGKAIEDGDMMTFTDYKKHFPDQASLMGKPEAPKEGAKDPKGFYLADPNDKPLPDKYDRVVDDLFSQDKIDAWNAKGGSKGIEEPPLVEPKKAIEGTYTGKERPTTKYPEGGGGWMPDMSMELKTEGPERVGPNLPDLPDDDYDENKDMRLREVAPRMIKDAVDSWGPRPVLQRDIEKAQMYHQTGIEPEDEDGEGDDALWKVIAGAVAAVAPALIGYSAAGTKGMYAGFKASGEGGKYYANELLKDERLKKKLDAQKLKDKGTTNKTTMKQSKYGEFLVITNDNDGNVINRQETGVIGPEQTKPIIDPVSGKTLGYETVPWPKKPVVNKKIIPKAGSKVNHKAPIAGEVMATSPEKTLGQWAEENKLPAGLFPPATRGQPLWKAIAGEKLWDGDTPATTAVRARKILEHMKKPKTSKSVSRHFFEREMPDGWIWKYKSEDFEDGTTQIRAVAPMRKKKGPWTTEDQMQLSIKSLAEEGKNDEVLKTSRMFMNKIPFAEQSFMYKKGNSTQNVNRLYSFMKLAQQDDTAVREGELYLNMYFQSLGDKLQRLYQAVKGESHFLSTDQMKSMDRDIATMYQAQMILATKRAQDYIERVNSMENLTSYQRKEILKVALGTGFMKRANSALKRSFGRTAITRAKTIDGVQAFARTQKPNSTFAWQKPNGEIVTYVKYPIKMGKKAIKVRRLFTFKDVK